MQNFSGMGDQHVKLDEYICDLNLDITNGGYTCVPLSSDGFSYMWGGVKGTYGIRSGKVCFEVKVDEYCEATNKDPTDTYVARVGWSTDSATLQLGEDKNSFGFGGTGKKSANRKFLNYGRRYEKGDVVGCYLAMENGWVDISYSVNGRYCGSAFKIRWMTDEALFPHILTKNCKLDVNFGQAAHPYFSLQPGYKLINHFPIEMRIPAVRPPISQRDCEVIMMVGLPGVGKSTWAMNYAKIHPSKKYIVLGTDSIIDKMRVMGLPRKNNFSGRWDVLIKQASDCFNFLLKKASTLPRNLILDQTNVYASARRRKVKQYRERGYLVNAMVLVPRDEDMIRRSKQRTIEEGKEVPEAAVLDMKANFSLPDEAERLFDNITFLELQRPEAQQLIEQYNREAQNRGHQSNQQRGIGMNQNQAQRKQFDRMSAPSMDQSYGNSSSAPAYNQNQYARSQSEQSYNPRSQVQNTWASGNEERQPASQYSRWRNSQGNNVVDKREESSGYGQPDNYGRSAPPSNSGPSYRERSPRVSRQNEAPMTYQQQQQQAFTDKWNEQMPKKQPAAGRPSRWGDNNVQETQQPTQLAQNMKTEHDNYGYSQQTSQSREPNWSSSNQGTQYNRGSSQQMSYYSSPQTTAKPEPKYEEQYQSERQPFPSQQSVDNMRPRQQPGLYGDTARHDSGGRYAHNQDQRFPESQGKFSGDGYEEKQYDQAFPKRERFDDDQSYKRQEPQFKQNEGLYNDDHYDGSYGREQNAGSGSYNQRNEPTPRREDVGNPSTRQFHREQRGGQEFPQQPRDGGFQQNQPPQRNYQPVPNPQNRGNYNEDYEDSRRQNSNNQMMGDRNRTAMNDPHLNNVQPRRQPNFNNQPPFNDIGPPQNARKPLLGDRPNVNQQYDQFDNGNYQGPNGDQVHQNRPEPPQQQIENRPPPMGQQYPVEMGANRSRSKPEAWNVNQDNYLYDERGNGQFDLAADDKKQLQFFDQQQSLIAGNQPIPNDQRPLPINRDDPLPPRREERSHRDEERGERSSRRDRERSPRDRDRDRDRSRSRRDDKRSRDDRRSKGDDDKRRRSNSRSRDSREERRRDRDEARSRRSDRGRDDSKTKREDRGDRRSSPRRSSKRSPDRRSPRRSDRGSRQQESNRKTPQAAASSSNATPGGAKVGLLPIPSNQNSMQASGNRPGAGSDLHDPETDQATLSKLASVDFDKLKASLANIRKTQVSHDEGGWGDGGFEQRGFDEGGEADMELDDTMMPNAPHFQAPRMPNAPPPRPRGPLLRTPAPMGRGQPRGPPPQMRPQFRQAVPEDGHFDEPPRKILLATPGGQEPSYGFEEGAGYDPDFESGEFPGMEFSGPPPGMPFGGPPPRFPGFRGPGGPRTRMPPRGFGGMRFRGARLPNGPRPMHMMGRGMRPPRPPMHGPM